MIIRPRRNRVDANMRDLVQENNLTVKDLIAPLFVMEGENKREEIASMPGQYRFTLDLLLKKVAKLSDLGIPAVSLFPALPDSLKDERASESTNSNNILCQAVRAIKKQTPNMLVMTDVAMDPYSNDGHDGLVDKERGLILNDETLPILAEMAVNQAQAGADIIGPSDMMDGRVAYIRQALDHAGLHHVVIMSYTAKYASAFYGPFRDALESEPKMGDKKTYQMNPANSREAIRELYLDEQEGADILMVKPGLPYLDILKEMRETTTLPLAVYNVSGEYAMVKAAAANGWLDEEKVALEILMSFKRAGADMILTYFAEAAAKWLKK